ncbi:inositol polyphosphate multikinase [Venturia nashicola]|uniref:Kinase n=1 Tax=Venturia nashicola TaxID=86259 RepID=A0A4Z1PSU7_9PEZI|nr:inositol polyphosphate multikinase [Venturia nashicola]TLD37998.1 inositol polyphosphate multikinase [Venturia nashicola]
MALHLDPSTLTSFDHAAAGHEGVLSDPSGDLVIKPCTQAEVSFYELATTSCPDLANFMPRYMGTLQRSASVAEATSGLPKPPPAEPSAAVVTPPVSGLQSLDLPVTHPPSSSVPGTAATLSLDDVGPMKGKKLDTDLNIVLENVTAKFKKPNVLDLKLGARLWDDGAKLEKRARLDKVSSETTSGSLGFRIAGMRIWQGKDKVVEGLNDFVASKDGQILHELDEDSNYLNHNKLYGRIFNADNVIEGFKKYLHVPHAGIGKRQAFLITQLFLEDVKGIQAALEALESRMYSASILLVYEGDGEAFEKAYEILSKPGNEVLEEEDENDDEEDEENDSTPRLYATRLIDFAHASFAPGQGPDENMLQGVRSTVKILEQLLAEYDE